MSHPGARRFEILFALGNLVPALVLGVGVFELPTRWWPADVLVGAAVLLVIVTTVFVFARPPLAPRALRVGASVLLGVGLVLIAAAALSLAFLAGIHGDFGQGGMALMLLVTLLVLPYTVGYPVVELRWLGPATRPVAAPPAANPAASPAASPAAEAPANDGGAPA